MGKKNTKFVDNSEVATNLQPASTVEMYAIHNLKELVFPVPYYNDQATIENLTLRHQGRGGQKPPVVPSTAITEKMRDLQKRGFIKLVKVKG